MNISNSKGTKEGENIQHAAFMIDFSQFPPIHSHFIDGLHYLDIRATAKNTKPYFECSPKPISSKVSMFYGFKKLCKLHLFVQVQFPNA